MTQFQKDKVQWFYINLDSRPDRRQHAEIEFAKHRIDVKRFKALLPEEWEGSPEKVAKMQAATPGAIGCYHSQISVIQKSVASGLPVAVCEDDVCFSSDLPLRLQYIENHLNWDWDIFYLGATFHVPGVWCRHLDCKDWGPRLGVDAETTEDPHIMRVYGEWGTYAYIINPNNAQKVLDLFDANIHRARGIDHLAIILGDKLNAYAMVPGCAWQYDNQSNIGGGLTVFSRFRSLGPYVWSDSLTDFDSSNYNWKTGNTL